MRRFMPLFLLGLFVPNTAGALPPDFAADPRQIHLQLVTFGPGASIHQYFGHNAMWVHDAATGQSALFNYGMFSFGSDMLPEYLKGRLTFWVAATPVRSTFEFYRRSGRRISVQTLNLGVEEKARIIRRLLHDVQPEHSTYQYDHFVDNCGTRLRDVIDEAVGGQFRKFLSKPGRMTYRDHVRRYTEHDVPFYMLLLFWMNADMERPLQAWDETFLPDELAAYTGRFVYVNGQGQRVPLVSRSYDLFVPRTPPVPPAPERPTPMFGKILGCGVLIGLGAWLLAWTYRRSRMRQARWAFSLYQAAIGAVFGIPGLLGTLMWMFTEHEVTYWNENQLVANPFTFALLPLGLMTACGHWWAARWAAWCSFMLGALSVLAVLAKALPAFAQANALPLALLVPTNLGLLLAHLSARQAFAVERSRLTAPGSGAAEPTSMPAAG